MEARSLVARLRPRAFAAQATPVVERSVCFAMSFFASSQNLRGSVGHRLHPLLGQRDFIGPYLYTPVSLEECILHDAFCRTGWRFLRVTGHYV